jgi:NADH:ubiquinone oxidoreductase subunit 6 (subunit J)
MSRRQIGMVVVLVGVVAALFAALADPLGIGGAEDTFGWKQGLLLAVGILLVIAGGVMVVRSPSSGTGAPPAP